MAWEELMELWAESHYLYVAKSAEMHEAEARGRERDAIQISRTSDGTPEHAADNTDAALGGTRVWLHQFEGPGGALLPSFCRRTGDAWYVYDFLGFSQPRVEQNALLSEAAKCLMFKLWKENPELWGAASLARIFRIRHQRALAIVKIKEEEFGRAEEAVAALNRLQDIFDLPHAPRLSELHADRARFTPRHLTAWFEPWLHFYENMPHLIHPESPGLGGAGQGGGGGGGGGGAGGEVMDGEESSAEGMATGDGHTGSRGEGGAEARGADEDRRKKLSTEEAEEVVNLHNVLALRANMEARHIATHDDVWRTAYHAGSRERYVPFLQTAPAFEERGVADAAAAAAAGAPLEYERLLGAPAAEEDAREIAEFERTLAWSLGETGKSIQRAPRKRGEAGSTVPRKPPGGWPILVTPLHAAGRRGAPFVAAPDGTRRALTDDEALYVDHFKREPKIFSRPRRMAPYTNETLHMFTQRKPNARHDVYTPPYAGPRRRRPTEGPTRRVVREARVAQVVKRRSLEKRLAGLRA